ncbi:MAG TPA: 2Fe-2S iron-sulfur cluster-binding protein, partial [Solirubrobacteraceae bacterium]|nr:2Fe-2S iron-sulfur cluster-binding protein [Solirubrobacteraceae bacterium]
MTRLPEQPGQRIDRSRELTFSFDGKPVRAFEGDTVGSALFAAGRRTFSRSFKYHRPRGLLCCAGQCPNCLVQVDGAPGVRACTEPVRAGMQVKHMNAVPSLDFDAMRATDLVGRPFTPPGFYYKTFIRPRRLWPVYEKVLRHAAGLGRAPDARPEREWVTEYRRRHADVLVVGGGVAGLSAAIAAAEQGADVVLADEGHEPGGRLLAEGGHEEARSLAARARAAGVELLVNAPALGYFDGLVPVWQGDTLHQIRAARHIFATGAIEQPLLFAGNDLPGVMLSGGALRLAALYGVSPGRRAVVATVDDRGVEAARALADLGVEIVAVADLRTGASIVEAKGRGRVRSVVLGDGEIDCDLLVVSGGSAPATSLLRQAGGNRPAGDSLGGMSRGDILPTVLAAGEVAGHGELEAARRSGE